MTWEETILLARKTPKYKDVIYLSYLNEDLVDNVIRYRSSEEFSETIKLIKNSNKASDIKLLDIGCGNGISAISFALYGFQVTAVEPDPSDTVGRGAIEKMANHFKLNMQIIGGVGEKLPLQDQTFDVVYLRQTLHHATNIGIFLKECFRVLKNGGIIFTSRDHVIFGKKDKEWFLSSHPFHRYYGGENAYLKKEYLEAFKNAGFQLISIMRHFDSVINYYPLSIMEYNNYPIATKEKIRKKLILKFGVFGKFPLLIWLLRCYKGHFPNWYNERLVSGRLYSFIAKKV